MQIGLADVINSLKSELFDLHMNPGEKMFLVGDVEIEIKFVIEKKREATGGGHYLFFAAEAKGSYKSENVHTIKLKLVPNSEWNYGRIAPAAPG